MKLQPLSLLAAIVLTSAGFATSASAASAPFTFLPTPENNANASYGMYKDGTGELREAIMMNGIPIAFKYDDMWSYSAKHPRCHPVGHQSDQLHPRRDLRHL